MGVDADYEVEPWLKRKILVAVLEDLKAVLVVSWSLSCALGYWLGVEPPYEAVEGPEHVWGRCLSRKAEARSGRKREEVSDS